MSGERQDDTYLITVEDSGSGIPGYAQEKILTAFIRYHGLIASKVQG